MVNARRNQLLDPESVSKVSIPLRGNGECKDTESNLSFFVTKVSIPLRGNGECKVVHLFFGVII